jgi:hypothetical protein
MGTEGRYRIALGAVGRLSRIWKDDVELTNVVRLSLTVGVNQMTELSLTLIPESVDVETPEMVVLTTAEEAQQQAK